MALTVSLGIFSAVASAVVMVILVVFALVRQCVSWKIVCATSSNCPKILAQCRFTLDHYLFIISAQPACLLIIFEETVVGVICCRSSACALQQQRMLPVVHCAAGHRTPLSTPWDHLSPFAAFSDDQCSLASLKQVASKIAYHSRCSRVCRYSESCDATILTRKCASDPLCLSSR